MKKAYVKPVFLAEEFVAEMSYANNGCGVSIYEPALITYETDAKRAEGTTADLCSGSEDGHFIQYQKGNGNSKGLQDLYDYNEKNDTNYDYWQYATAGDNKATLFVTVLCDFIWNPTSGNTGNVSVWDTVTGRTEGNQYGSKIIGTFMKFFTGNNAQGEGHTFKYKGTLTPVSG